MAFEYPARTVPDTMSKKDKESVGKKMGRLIRKGKSPEQAVEGKYKKS